MRGENSPALSADCNGLARGMANVPYLWYSRGMEKPTKDFSITATEPLKFSVAAGQVERVVKMTSYPGWRFVTDGFGVSHHVPTNETRLLTNSERATAFAYFCSHCGSNNPRCQCWNDE